MQSVSAYKSSAKQSSAYQADIAERQKKLDESVEKAAKAGQLSDSQRAALVKMARTTSAMLQRYTADGRLDSAEYKRVLQYTQNEQAALGKMVDAAGGTKKSGTRNSDKAVANQKRSIAAARDGQSRAEDLLKKVESYGMLDNGQLKTMDALVAKGRTLLTDAMKDGVLTRSEYDKVTDAQTAVNRQLRQYQSAPRAASASSSSASGGASSGGQGLDVTA